MGPSSASARGVGAPPLSLEGDDDGVFFWIRSGCI